MARGVIALLWGSDPRVGVSWQLCQGFCLSITIVSKRMEIFLMNYIIKETGFLSGSK